MFLFMCRHLVNTLAKEPQSAKPEDVEYKGSCLTHLLRESLGGNSKLTVICAISPDNKYFSLTTCSFNNLYSLLVTNHYMHTLNMNINLALQHWK